MRPKIWGDQRCWSYLQRSYRVDWKREIIKSTPTKIMVLFQFWFFLLGWKSPSDNKHSLTPSKKSGLNNALWKLIRDNCRIYRLLSCNNYTNQLDVAYYTLSSYLHTVNYLLNCRNYKIGKSDQYITGVLIMSGKLALDARWFMTHLQSYPCGQKISCETFRNLVKCQNWMVQTSCMWAEFIFPSQKQRNVDSPGARLIEMNHLWTLLTRVLKNVFSIITSQLFLGK